MYSSENISEITILLLFYGLRGLSGPAGGEKILRVKERSTRVLSGGIGGGQPKFFLAIDGGSAILIFLMHSFLNAERTL